MQIDDAKEACRGRLNQCRISPYSSERIPSHSQEERASSRRNAKKLILKFKIKQNVSLTQHPNDVPLRGALPSAGVAVIRPSRQVLPLHRRRQQPGPSQLDGDQYVEDDDDGHRQHEEQHGGYLERVFDQRPFHRASGAVEDRRAVAVLVNHAKLDRLRHRQAQRQQPNHYDELHRSGQLRHCVRDERMTDRHVPETETRVSRRFFFFFFFL